LDGVGRILRKLRFARPPGRVGFSALDLPYRDDNARESEVCRAEAGSSVGLAVRRGIVIMLLKVEYYLNVLFLCLHLLIAMLPEGDEQRISQLARACGYQPVNP
jgi:hypothetical protein